MNTIEDINKQIDKIVKVLQQKIIDMGNKFVPWKKLYEDASYYLEKGFIDKSDNAKFRTIDDIGKIFNMKNIPMGYKIHGYIPISINLKYIWCPILKLEDDKLTLKNYENTISEDGKYIFEIAKINNDKFVKKILENDIERYVFAKYKDEVGNILYKFLGIYTLDKEKTSKSNIRIWKRIDTRINLIIINEYMINIGG